jgi:hypothetical protein
MSNIEEFLRPTAKPGVIAGCLVFANQAAHEFFRFDPIKVTKEDLKLFGRYPLGNTIYTFKLVTGDKVFSMFTNKGSNVFALSTLLGCRLHGDIRKVPLGRRSRTLDNWFKDKARRC